MKRSLLTLTVCILFGKLFAQNEYFQNDPRWLCYHSASPWPCYILDSANYYINGDSIINSVTYKVMYKRGHFKQGDQMPPGPCVDIDNTYQDTLPTGFMRSQGMQMFYIPNEDSVEHLLYDFNLIVGSHTPVTYINSDTTFIVTSIDSIYTPAGYRKRYYLNGNNFEFLIEGVGSSGGLFFPPGLLFEQAAGLVCYSQNDTAWWPTQGPVCALITSDDELNTATVSLQLIPNPAHGNVEIQMNGELPRKVEVYDALGVLVKSESGVSEFTVEDLSAGIYFVRVTSGETQYMQRLIVE